MCRGSGRRAPAGRNAKGFVNQGNPAPVKGRQRHLVVKRFAVIGDKPALFARALEIPRCSRRSRYSVRKWCYRGATAQTSGIWESAKERRFYIMKGEIMAHAPTLSSAWKDGRKGSGEHRRDRAAMGHKEHACQGLKVHRPPNGSALPPSDCSA